MRYDIAVIGNDEGAFRMLEAAAATRLRTIAILPESRHSAWLTSQALRRLVSGLLADDSEERRLRLRQCGNPRLLRRLLAGAIVDELSESIRDLEILGIDVLLGEARFLGRSELCVSSGMDCSRVTVQADNFVIGTGVRQTSSHRTLGLLPISGPESLFDTWQLMPQLQLLGGGDLGAGLAALFSLFGVRTSFVPDDDESTAMLELAESTGVRIVPCSDRATYSSGRGRGRNQSSIVDCRRSLGFTENLNLAAVGIEADENGQLWCANHGETWCQGIFGIGEVVGFQPECDSSLLRQAQRVITRLTHRIPRPHFLRSAARQAMSSIAGDRSDIFQDWSPESDWSSQKSGGGLVWN